ncbi:MAG: hypothetical protein KDH19_12080, partial [Geminicoccaceae bacterium]|nr:hypothetical protein [Geminicoccaceae bacterium]
RHIELTLGDPARTWLANAGYDPVYGARPLKRVIQKTLQDRLATMILEGRIRDGDTVMANVEDGEIILDPLVEAEAA